MPFGSPVLYDEECQILQNPQSTRYILDAVPFNFRSFLMKPGRKYDFHEILSDITDVAHLAEFLL